MTCIFVRVAVYIKTIRQLVDYALIDNSSSLSNCEIDKTIVVNQMLLSKFTVNTLTDITG